MMRGGNRGMRRMIDKMGLDVDEIKNVLEVVIKTDKKEIIVEKPSVSEMKSKDATIFTVTAADGGYSERELEVPVFPDEDIDMVCEETGVDREKAAGALAEADGDLARAILALSDQ